MPQTNVVWLGYLLSVLLRRAGSYIVPGSNALSTKLQKAVFKELSKVLKVLEIDLEQRPRSALDLLKLADREHWLKKEDADSYKCLLEQDE